MCYPTIKEALKLSLILKRDKLSSKESSKKSFKIQDQDIIRFHHNLGNTMDKFTIKFVKESVAKMVGEN